MTIEFKAWPKISRLANEKVTVTEKIDGTNACVIFLPHEEDGPAAGLPGYRVGVQSRSRLITVDNDNFGFAKWVDLHSASLFADLGFGYHYGEWWGSGIQRGYGLEKGEKRFSVFNAVRWQQAFEEGHKFSTPGLSTVPLLAHGPFELVNVRDIAHRLYIGGSHAAPGFLNPEGVVVYLHEAKVSYKVTDAAVGTKERYASE